MSHTTHIFFHVVLFGLWLGPYAALLVLIGRLRLIGDQPQAVETLLKSVRLIERVPRTAFILMLPMGLQLSHNLGYIAFSTGNTLGVWVVALVWLAIDWRGARQSFGPAAQAARVVFRVLASGFGAVVGGAGLLSLVTGGPIALPWLAGKFTLFGLALVIMILIDLAVAQFYPRQQGKEAKAGVPSDPALIAKAASQAGTGIVALLVVLAAAAWMGVVKPFA
ncbi:hypothetical protein EV659_102389 [Rhodothalassium salexigens DSM 2132]|uniref:Uncharacterized protein n=1 Tax=Rhodothalassium salexigens DSM 2132 TaxID=1188247 RepID=A0A4R2PSP3_RHOSA|nr:hypothetical protein [Rhodothalassium salexigens]MBB4210465.1 hypothetical protein [Rhodothalassium salexigens DSM 2132]MBK1638211.1 hypothetical protein [Rhodothalassium salexigens DSM 2132]TCP37978.1 hypothetical protein EV659_102389 [Rhodothalassium salexigens DSM 2132]